MSEVKRFQAITPVFDKDGYQVYGTDQSELKQLADCVFVEDYDALREELAAVKADRDSWRRVAESYEEERLAQSKSHDP